MSSLPRYFQTMRELSVQNTFTAKNLTFVATQETEHRVGYEINGMGTFACVSANPTRRSRFSRVLNPKEKIVVPVRVAETLRSKFFL